MVKPKLVWYSILLHVFILSLIHKSASGYDITDKFSIGGILAGAYQFQSGNNIEDKDRGALSFQPELSFRPTGRDEIYTKFGFAAGNGLNTDREFNFAPWAATLEGDLKNINGRNRDYLLTAWYKHIFNFLNNHALALTGGIIDATDFVDENAFANDEHTQFMNEALVNGPNGFAPSYDIGGAIEWEFGSWAIKGVGMNIGENDDGNNSNFFAAQIGYAVYTSFGKGYYRLIGETTSEDFLDANGNKKRILAVLLSFDQELGDIFGAWIRFGWQDDKALVDYDYLVSGGINICGKWYGRESDNIGIGYAYVNGADESDFDHSQVAEVYWRFVFNEYISTTVDFQFLSDAINSEDNDIDGIILGIRGVIAF